MTAVDTGWITEGRPLPTKTRLHDEGFQAPLDVVDGAARGHDPIVHGELGLDAYGDFFQDFAPSPRSGAVTPVLCGSPLLCSYKVPSTFHPD